MNPEADWQSIRGDRGSVLGIAGIGILRITLLFGSAAVALALILAPIADSQTRQFVGGAGDGLDRMPTGSIGRSGAAGSYTIRRSVLQVSPSAICIIRDNGTRSGDCG
jgi:hypothetical protein